MSRRTLKRTALKKARLLPKEESRQTVTAQPALGGNMRVPPAISNRLDQQHFDCWTLRLGHFADLDVPQLHSRTLEEASRILERRTVIEAEIQMGLLNVSVQL